MRLNNYSDIAFVDCEVCGGKVSDIGAVRGGSEFHSKSRREFVDFLRGASFVAGHNIIDHDLRYLNDEIRESKITRYIDTLYLSPLLFAQKPYHKLLKDDKFDPRDQNNPLNDAIKARDLFFDELAKFEELSDEIKTIYYPLLKNSAYFKDFFLYVGYEREENDLVDYINNLFINKFCANSKLSLIANKYPVELAYAIAQIAVMSIDTESITPPWVLKRFPKVENILHALKGQSCGECEYCKDKLDAARGLKKWFGYDAFRSYDGQDLQKEAAECAISGKSLLAVFPTGGGKSITFQLPALMQGENEKGLTVVISPLQSLQKDQVDNLEEKHGITKAVRIDGSLEPIERQCQINMVENGSASLLYISPESLRSKTHFKMLLKRNVVRFVVDEAHCFSAWGQDFRTDYLYIAEFIKKLQEAKNNNRQIPVSCFTATAKDEVIRDICKYFSDNLNLELEKIVSSAGRQNLKYNAIHVVDEGEKDIILRELLHGHNCPTIIYVSRTRRADAIADKLTQCGFNAIGYHGKMDKTERVRNQEQFISGKCDIIVATKAFGMGVDKDNVKLVVHYDISTSLEDYVQEAGRAGRDANLQAACVALFNDDDINKHFAFLSQTKITQQEIGQIWRGVKRIANKCNRTVINESALDIARAAGWNDEPESDIKTRVTTAINALEQVRFLKRGENSPQIFADGILCKTIAAAQEKIRASNIFENDAQKNDALKVVSRLFKTRAKGGRDADGNNEHVDYIADREGLSTNDVVRIVCKLRESGILADTKDLYGFLQRDQGRTAKSVLNAFENAEMFLWEFFAKNQNDIALGKKFNIKELSTKMIGVYPNTSISHLKKLLNFYDIKHIIKKSSGENRDYVGMKCLFEPDIIRQKGEKRISIAKFIVGFLYDKPPKEAAAESGPKVEFSVMEIKDAFNRQGHIFNILANAGEVEDALYYLKKIGAIEIDGGFLVIYNRMSIKRLQDDNNARYTKEHYKELDKYYGNKKEQIHIVSEYLKLLSADYEQALAFTHDYFIMNYDMFKQKYFKGRVGELKRNMTPAKFDQLFKSLTDTQRKIIENDKDKYIAVVAGPGSGKTMLLTHKLAAICLQEDIKHEQILMLTFSRAAAGEFKRKLLKLIGNAANFIKIKTFHSYCFDLLGRVGSLDKTDGIIEEAISKIEQNQADEFKLTNAITVIDEAQDMSEAEYRLVQTLFKNNDGMKLIAVGDDDQNIYEFRGSSSIYLGKIAEAKNGVKYELIENFRSAKNIVQFANAFARKIKARLKTQNLQAIKQKNGQITICKLNGANIETPITNAYLDTAPNGGSCIIVRTNEQVNNIVGLLTKRGIKARAIQTNTHFNLYDLAEVRDFCNEVFQGQSATIDADMWNDAKSKLEREYFGSHDLPVLQQIIKEFETLHSRHKYKNDLEQFIKESKLEDFIVEQTTVLVSTVHQTKGREFDNVFFGYAARPDNQMSGEEARQIYVAITRAKNKLYICTNSDRFDDVDAYGVRRFADSTIYGPPEKIVVELTHKDVFLDCFVNAQSHIHKLKSGDALQLTTNGIILSTGKTIRFSKAFCERIKEKQDQNYFATGAVVNHIVWWCRKDDAQSAEIKIILPCVEFEKRV